MTDQTPRDVLIYARLLEKFEDDHDDMRAFVQGHIDKGLDPTVDCADFYCQDARRYADNILDLFKRNELGVSHAIYLTQQAFEKLEERLDEPPKVNDGLLVALSRRRAATTGSARQSIWNTVHEGQQLDWPADKVADNVVWNLDDAGYEIRRRET